jgi:hypothetical protein
MWGVITCRIGGYDHEGLKREGHAVVTVNGSSQAEGPLTFDDAMTRCDGV